MNLTAILACALGALALCGAVGWKAYHAGQDSVIASQARDAELIAKARDAAMNGAAEAIAKIEIKHTTVRQQLETEIREKPVYRDCTASDGVLRLVNEAITGVEPTDPGLLPGARPHDGADLR